MIAAHVLLAIGTDRDYRRGPRSRQTLVGQGVRFGFWFAVASCIPGFLIYYAVEPMPLNLVAKQIIFETFSTVLLGLTLAGLNKQTA